MGTDTHTMTPIQLPPVDVERIVKELNESWPAVQAELRLIEEAKVVSQETMQLEVSY